MSDPVFLSVEQVRLLHRKALEQHGGLDGIRDVPALESAAFQPRNTWYFAQGDLFDIAAAYAYHISQSQAFLDGNKRTGLATALVFLRLNGITLRRNTDMLHGAMIAMSGQRIGKDELAAIFRQISR